MGRHNAIVASQTTLAKAAHCSLPTLKRALSILREQGWIEVRQIGPTGTACAYVINDRVAWTGKRDGIRYSLFSRSEEHTSEIQSLMRISSAVFCLKKKQHQIKHKRQ